MRSSTDNKANPRRAMRPWLLGGILVAVTAVAYLPSMNAAFLWDDGQNIVDNASIRSLGEVIPYAAQSRRPLIYLSLWVNYAWGGLNVVGYHALNLAVHLVAGLALFGLVARTLQLPGRHRRYAQHAELFAFCVALIWMVHPLQTQAVTYVIQRCESMMGMFYLLCLYCLVRASQANRPWPWYALSLSAGYLGMGCKEVMITAPIVLLLYDRACLSDSWKAVLRKRWAFYLGLVPAAVWLVSASVALNPEGNHATAGFSCATVTPWEYLRSQPGVILHYLSLAAFPSGLCFDYRWPVAQQWSAIALAAGVLAILLAGSIWTFRLRPAIGLLGLSFFLILAPTSSIMPIADLAVEHRMYLPLVPLVILAVFGFHRLVSHILRPEANSAPLYAVALVTVALLLSTRTFARNLVYRTPISIWSVTVAAAPRNARAHQNLGYHLHQQGKIDLAIEHYLRAVELDPEQMITHGYLAVALAAQGRQDAAIAHLRAVLQDHREFGRGHFLLGELLAERGETSEAVEHFRQALQIQPNAAPAHHALGAELVRMGHLGQAVVHLRKACELQPQKAEYCFDLGSAYQQARDYQRALTCYRRTLAVEANHAAARRNIQKCRTALDTGASASAAGQRGNDSWEG